MKWQKEDSMPVSISTEYFDKEIMQMNITFACRLNTRTLWSHCPYTTHNIININTI